MNDCINRGMEGTGILPGGLKVRRRAKGIHDALMAERGLNMTAPHTINDWMSLYAMAVNEENAAGGQVVTAPTNGAAGVVPAVIRYYLDHVPGASQSKVGDFMLTAAAIGGLVKHNAIHFGRGMRLSGRGWISRRDGRRRTGGRAGRHAWNRWKTPPRLRWNITLA